MTETTTTWENLEISNNFMFGKVMQNPDICKELLEIILDIKIERIEYPVAEKTIKLTYDGKGVRLDVYVADEAHTVYNVEMQATNTGEIAERSRYYQGIIDMELIEKGEVYSKLNRSYVIFICTFDLFKQGRYRYTFEHRCVEDTSIGLDDGTTRIFLNTKGILESESISDDMKAFLAYVEGNGSDNSFVKKVAEEVDVVKSSKKWRVEYMNQVVRDQLNKDAGIKIGKELGKIELIRTKMLKLKSLEVIAEELECGIEEIRGLYDVVKECGPESSMDEIMKVISKCV